VFRRILVALWLSLLISSTFASTSRGPVVIREDVSAAHRTELINKLRKITGWTRLTFRPDGTLSIGGPETVKGSKAAQALLAKALNGRNVIVLEDASARADVAFCRVVPGKWLSNGVAQPDVYVVLIDFTDFEQIIGDDEAREAFDVGWGLLHELDHIVTDSADAEDVSDIGECEDHINLMREELGLPLRSNYFFTASALKTDPNFNRRFVRLAFEQRSTSTRRSKRYWLTWDSAAVGGLAISSKRLARSSPDIF